MVAWNLARARQWRGWTQEQAAEALEPYLGTRWSKASYSAAERSVSGNRIRQFTADEIVAFARGFDLPVSWFFLPPPPLADVKGVAVPVRVMTPDEDKIGLPASTMVDLVFGAEEAEGALELSLRDFFDRMGDGPLTLAQERVERLATMRIEALVRHAFGDIDQWQRSLHGIAQRLEYLEVRARPEKRADIWRGLDEEIHSTEEQSDADEPS
ncbi:MAG TPA: helix-turn-helix transcriptional regulator [Acidimicrobiales bacterium]|nr:helix-turn-helix transcriptional regulator [Acidimicrobiales bacterium]